MTRNGPQEAPPAAPGPDRFAARLTGMPVWAIWAVFALAFTLLTIPAIVALRMNDPDDYMRLLEVRDLIAGQGWFDMRQHRMNYPAGADMHWTRLVDMPLAAIAWGAGLVLPAIIAERVALVLVPLITMLVAMVLVRSLMRALGASSAHQFAALAVIPMFPLLTYTFSPMRIDHHGWQAVCALGALVLMIRGGWRNAFAAGLAGAAWLHISIEGMPLVAALCGLFAVRYWLHGRRDFEGFLAGLTLGGAGLFALLHPVERIGQAWCDALSWPHLTAFALATGIAAATRFAPAQQSPLGRIVALVPVAAAAAAWLLATLGICAVDPMAGLDPYLQQYWFAQITESAPLTDQTYSVMAMLLSTLAIVIWGTRIALRHADGAVSRENWLMVAAMALIAAGLSLIVMRVGLTAQLLALPFAAAILHELMPRARAIGSLLPRVLATLACFGLATPVLVSSALKPFDERKSTAHSFGGSETESSACNVALLQRLPRATLFAPVDQGPEILVRSPHRVVMGGYHRNQEGIRTVYSGFIDPVGQAKHTILGTNADYVTACVGKNDLRYFAKLGPHGIAAAMLAGEPPDWLVPVPGFERGSLRVWKVNR